MGMKEWLLRDSFPVGKHCRQAVALSFPAMFLDRLISLKDYNEQKERREQYRCPNLTPKIARSGLVGQEPKETALEVGCKDKVE